MTAPDRHGNTQIRRHRAPLEGVARLGAKLGAAALVIAAIAVGGVIRTYTPDVDTRERPFVRGGSQGEALSARKFEVRVLGVRGATKISRSGKTRDTGGVWVLVKVRVMAYSEPTTIGHAAVLDDRGRTFDATERITQPLVGGRTLQPGIHVESEIAFEVPQDVAGELTVQIGPHSLDERMDAMVEVPVRVDRATVDRWLAETKAIPIEDEEVAR